MITLKKIIVAAVIAAALPLTGCNTLEAINDRGQALRAADPAAYDLGDSNYFSQNPSHNVHGS